MSCFLYKQNVLFSAISVTSFDSLGVGNFYAETEPVAQQIDSELSNGTNKTNSTDTKVQDLAALNNTNVEENVKNNSTNITVPVSCVLNRNPSGFAVEVRLLCIHSKFLLFVKINILLECSFKF